MKASIPAYHQSEPYAGARPSTRDQASCGTSVAPPNAIVGTAMLTARASSAYCRMWVSSWADASRPGPADPRLHGGDEAALALVPAQPDGGHGGVQRGRHVDGGAPLVAEQRQPGVGQREAGVDRRRVQQRDLGPGLHPQQGVERGVVGHRGLGRGAHRQAVAVPRPAAVRAGRRARPGAGPPGRGPGRGSPGSRSTRRAGRAAARRGSRGRAARAPAASSRRPVGVGVQPEAERARAGCARLVSRSSSRAPSRRCTRSRGPGAVDDRGHPRRPTVGQGHDEPGAPGRLGAARPTRARTTSCRLWRKPPDLAGDRAGHAVPADLPVPGRRAQERRPVLGRKPLPDNGVQRSEAVDGRAPVAGTAAWSRRREPAPPSVSAARVSSPSGQLGRRGRRRPGRRGGPPAAARAGRPRARCGPGGRQRARRRPWSARCRRAGRRRRARASRARAPGAHGSATNRSERRRAGGAQASSGVPLPTASTTESTYRVSSGPTRSRQRRPSGTRPVTRSGTRSRRDQSPAAAQGIGQHVAEVARRRASAGRRPPAVACSGAWTASQSRKWSGRSGQALIRPAETLSRCRGVGGGVGDAEPGAGAGVDEHDLELRDRHRPPARPAEPRPGCRPLPRRRRRRCYSPTGWSSHLPVPRNPYRGSMVSRACGPDSGRLGEAAQLAQCRSDAGHDADADRADAAREPPCRPRRPAAAGGPG